MQIWAARSDLDTEQGSAVQFTAYQLIEKIEILRVYFGYTKPALVVVADI